MKYHAFRKLFYIILAVSLVCVALPAYAKVSAEEAERLKKDLTPLGAIRAGNAEGTIPAWEGGIKGIPEGITYDPASGKERPDPFADEKPLFIITAQNLDQYRNLVTPGTQMLFKKFPDTFQMHVYPTHRTTAVPQFIADAVYKNATRTVVSGNSMKNAYGGPGFPIPNWESPEAGLQLQFNNVSAWKGGDRLQWENSWVVYPDTMKVSREIYVQYQYPYLWKDGNLESYEARPLKYFGAALAQYSKPASSKGSIDLAHRTMDFETGSDCIWQYGAGTRRVRRAPGLTDDYPQPHGMGTYDDAHQFLANPKRFEWTYVETKEMLIPYNCYSTSLATLEELGTPYHVNPKYLRWELHRVHVVEANLREGKRHVYGKRVYYQDEDTWTFCVQDKYDTRGKLWRLQYQGCINAYPFEFTFVLKPVLFYDFQVDRYIIEGLATGLEKSMIYESVPDETFTVEYLRKLGRR